MWTLTGFFIILTNLSFCRLPSLRRKISERKNVNLSGHMHKEPFMVCKCQSPKCSQSDRVTMISTKWPRKPKGELKWPGILSLNLYTYYIGLLQYSFEFWFSTPWPRLTDTYSYCGSESRDAFISWVHGALTTISFQEICYCHILLGYPRRFVTTPSPAIVVIHNVLVGSYMLTAILS